MTTAELTAYRDLCRRWPECEDTRIFRDAKRGWCTGFESLDDDIVDRIIIGHLETAVLGAFAYEPPGWGDSLHRYRIAVCVSVAGLSRLAALLAACEAVLSERTKG